jgi:hypothetical protein
MLVLAGLLAAAAPAVARAEDGSQEDVRVQVSCSRNSEVRLRLRTEDGPSLRVEVEVRTPRRGARWRVTMIHERRLVLRIPRRTRWSSGSITLRRTIPDWPGQDRVTVRAIGPRGELCRATAAVQGV